MTGCLIQYRVGHVALNGVVESVAPIGSTIALTAFVRSAIKRPVSDASTTTSAWTIGKLLDWTRGHFDAKGVEDARLCAELLLAHALGCEKIHLYARFHEEPTAEQRTAFRDLVKKAAEHYPIAYLIGRREFYSLDFDVTPAVLIPRPETEQIVELVLDRCKQTDAERIDVLDIGTGSGCLAVTLAKREPRVHVVATDISAATLEVAQVNIDKHGVGERIECVESDIFASLNGQAATGFDFIVSNPPYVALRERETLPRNVRDYEPESALFAGDDGLDFYRALAAPLADYLRLGGRCYFEIGEDQADAVVELLSAGGRVVSIAAHSDLAGTPRILEFERSA